MTVSYSHDLISIKWFTFLRVLCRWRGSIYKLVLPDLGIFLVLFATFSLIYRFALPVWAKDGFERFCVYCSQFENLIPVIFILGFFVQLVVSRWSEQSNTLPYPDHLAFLLNAYVTGDEEADSVEPSPGPSHAAKCHVDGNSKAHRARLIRRTIMRYANLSIVAAFRRVSYPVKKKIPNEEDFVSLQLMNDEEMRAWTEFPVENKYFLPLYWSSKLLSEARAEGLIKSDLQLKALQNAVDSLRGKIGMIFFYDFITPPLAYAQATTVCVYIFFLATLFGRQFLSPPEKFKHVVMDSYVPVFTIFQFVFYVGWLKVAEELINPYGKGDEDLDILYFIKRNLEVTGLMINILPPKLSPEESNLQWDTTDLNLPKGKWAPGLDAESATPFSGSTSNVKIRSHSRVTPKVSTQSNTSNKYGHGMGPISTSKDVEQQHEDIELASLAPSARKQFSDSKTTAEAPLIPTVVIAKDTVDSESKDPLNNVA